MLDARLVAATRIGDAALIIGTAIGLLILRRRHGWKAFPVVAITLACGFYGSRIWGAIAYDHASVTSDIWWRAVTWNYYAYYGHASIVGGILGGIVAVATSSLLFRLPMSVALGALVPGVAAGQAVGRIQCYVVGCCFGKPTKLPWGVVYPADTHAGFWSGPIPLHPTQLYESVLDTALFLVLLRLIAQSRERDAGAVFLAGYGVIRLFVEFFRVGRDAHLLYLSSAQWVSMALIVSGVTLWTKARASLGTPREFQSGTLRQ